MPTIWSYADPANRGFGLFKRLVLSALEAHGWTTRLALQPLLDPASKAKLRDDLLNNQPDWILLINQSAGQLYDYLEIENSRRPLPSKKLIWYLDDPEFFIDRPFEPYEYVFSFDETYLDGVKKHNPALYGFWPLAADMDAPGQYDARFACDVCFVGGAIDQSARREQLSPVMQNYVNELVELKLQHREKTFTDLSIEHPIEPGKCIQIQPQVANYLYWEANNRYRIRTLETLIDLDLRIYGNEDWPILLKDSPLLEKFHGPIDPVNELPHAFASAKINLNIHSVQCRGSLNQRDFNAPVAGGFLLSDWAPAAARYFAPGCEAAYWSDRDDLHAQVNYYLDHTDERRQIVQQGAHCVQNKHTYHHRVANLLEMLSGKI
ncbi:MAG: glycosyltransferase [Candidatus Hinthialibacter antarcticus]|nr:glycosyltransferase [Candidatus Hinthialibacter antarcticus]